MYREPHLQQKSNQCAALWTEWYTCKYELRDHEKAKKVRNDWCQCCDEFSKMISQELKTNERYIGHKLP